MDLENVTEAEARRWMEGQVALRREYQAKIRQLVAEGRLAGGGIDWLKPARHSPSAVLKTLAGLECRLAAYAVAASAREIRREDRRRNLARIDSAAARQAAARAASLLGRLAVA